MSEPIKEASKKEIAKEVIKPKAELKKKPTVLPKKGFISFEADDDVEIFVNDKLVAKNNWSSVSIAPGEHRVKMIKKGFLPIDNKVMVKTGQTTKIRAKGKGNG